MASSIQLNSTNNSEMKIEYQGTSGVPKTVVVPDRNMTVAGTDEVIGVGQTWQDVTASRALGVTYTNTTGKPIMISFRATVNAAGIFLACYVGSLQVASSSSAYTAGALISLSFIVQNGETYRISLSSGATTSSNWSELR